MVISLPEMVEKIRVMKIWRTKRFCFRDGMLSTSDKENGCSALSVPACTAEKDKSGLLRLIWIMYKSRTR